MVKFRDKVQAIHSPVTRKHFFKICINIGRISDCDANLKISITIELPLNLSVLHRLHILKSLNSNKRGEAASSINSTNSLSEWNLH